MSMPLASSTAASPLRVLFAAGGTGGHVYPAVAIADAVRALRPNADVLFAGTRERMEWEAVPKAGYAIRPITVAGLPRTLNLNLLRFPFRLLKGLAESRALVRSFRPHVAVGTGGFVAGPVLLAASLAGVPVVIQEQNAFAGVTNRLLARRAAEVHVAFDEARGAFPAGKAVVSGNPVRAVFAEAAGARRAEGRAFFGIPEGARLLVVFGGSLGAQKVNEALVAALPALLADADVHVVWATGPRYFERVEAHVKTGFDGSERVHIVRYLDRMELAYAAADLVLCRAGAITCSELMATGTPAVLVPSPNVAEDHQTHNARSLERAGAARLLPETDLATLAPTLQTLLADAPARARMATAALALARPDAAASIAARVVALVEKPPPR